MKFLIALMLAWNAGAVTRIFERVEVSGRFEREAGFKNWVVFVEYLEGPQKGFQSDKARVQSDGTFVLVLKSVPKGEYLFQFGDSTTKTYGGGPITIDGNTINLGTKKLD